MRDRLVITITDFNGSKHYNAHQIIKKIAFAVVMLTVATLIIGFIIITMLADNVENLTTKKDQLALLNTEYNQRISGLNSQIQQKTSELQNFSDDLESIESLIGLADDIDLPLQKRVDLAKINSVHKHHMLNSIPNGSPLKKFKITGNFGWRNHPVLNKKKFHKGIDLKASRKTAIFAPADGVVSYIGFQKKSGFGKLLVLTHNYGFKTYYAHLSKIPVKLGQIITKGQQIALSGNTGRSSGPHLHYEVRYIGVSIDPINFIKWDLNNYESIFKTTTGIQWQSLVEMITKNQQHL